MHIVLHEPEIPQNTGNIARTCAATGAKLHLIEPLGFSIDDKTIKRAGLDYWHLVDVITYKNFEEFLEKNHFPKIYMATTKSRQTYTEVTYEEDAYIMFGKETAGIPEEILLRYKQTAIRVPMIKDARSLNLSNSVAIVLYEALRQNDFLSLKTEGELHHYQW
jgi:tRNA (cytidine/uridine-2'-O-)-methyltransferase